jgi:hypothetical protein
MIPVIASIATLAFIAVGFTVGARLLWLSRQTHGVGEFTLGLGLLLIVGIGYPLLLTGTALAAGTPTPAARSLLASGTTCMSIGWSCVWIFTWRVFRPSARAAALVVFAAIAALATVLWLRLARIFLSPDVAAILEPGVASLGTPLIAIASYFWTSTEAFHYWAMLRRRRVLGLSDAVVTNRFFLWGLVGVFSGLSLVPHIVQQLRGIGVVDETTQILGSISGLATSFTLLLAFLPPRAYLRWCSGNP